MKYIKWNGVTAPVNGTALKLAEEWIAKFNGGRQTPISTSRFDLTLLALAALLPLGAWKPSEGEEEHSAAARMSDSLSAYDILTLSNQAIIAIAPPAVESEKEGVAGPPVAGAAKEGVAGPKGKKKSKPSDSPSGTSSPKPADMVSPPET